MPQYQQELVKRRGVFYSEGKRRLITALPCMTGNRNGFFIKVNRGAGNNCELQAASCENVTNDVFKPVQVIVFANLG